MEKLIILVIIFGVIIIYLRNVNSEIAMLATIAAGIIIISFTINYLSETFDIINELIELSGINRELYEIIFKISALGYLIEFGADTVQDFGLKSLSDKLILVGKIVIFSVSLPIIYAIFNLLKGLMG